VDRQPSGLRPAPRGGCAPATRQNHPEEGEPRGFLSLPLVGPEFHGTAGATKTCSHGAGGLEQIQILSAAHLAGFEVFTHGRI
jgi:hypothetical protein